MTLLKLMVYGPVIFCAIWLVIVLASCTLSFQNISTHGTATDLVDENQKADADISTTLDLT